MTYQSLGQIGEEIFVKRLIVVVTVMLRGFVAPSDFEYTTDASILGCLSYEDDEAKAWTVKMFGSTEDDTDEAFDVGIFHEEYDDAVVEPERDVNLANVGDMKGELFNLFAV